MDPKALFWRGKAQYYRGESEKGYSSNEEYNEDPDKECMAEIRKNAQVGEHEARGQRFFQETQMGGGNYEVPRLPDH